MTQHLPGEGARETSAGSGAGCQAAVQQMDAAACVAARADRDRKSAALRMSRFRARQRAERERLVTARAAAAAELAAARAEHGALRSHAAALDQLDGYTQSMLHALPPGGAAGDGDPGESSATTSLVEAIIAGLGSKLLLCASDAQLR